MKKSFLVFSLFIITAMSYSEITDVQERGGFAVVYGDNGREITRRSLGDNTLVGVTKSFFVFQNEYSIILYNEQGKEISRMPSEYRKVKNAVGETFSVEEHGKWIVTYDKNCKMVSKRPK